MAGEFDIEARWPDIFATLSPLDRWAVVQSLACAWHEGWVPNREDVADLAAVTRGVIDDEEYKARTNAKIERNRADS